jgi:hypothetical protein
MGHFSDYYKIVTTSSDVTAVQDNQNINSSSAAYGQYTWYQRIVMGSATRLTRYREYDIMDNDVEVARALDIIAEEMTTPNTKTNMVLDVDMQAEDTQDIDNNIVLTLRAALRHWSNIHKFSRGRLFKIARTAIKYGDCFFIKRHDYKQWEWIPSVNVIAAVVDAEDVTDVIGYQVRTDSKTPSSLTSGTTPGMPGTATTALGSQYTIEYIPVEQMVVFSLNDDMSDSAPFGESVLRYVYRAHKQKELLEDAIVIYRIQRAPERRVFYIDTGKMPPQRKKQYLETIKNEIRQKKIPSNNMNGGDSMDSVYNPMSMLEDIFLSQDSDGKGSKVDVLPGGNSQGSLDDLDYFINKVIRGLRVPISWMRPDSSGGGIFNDGKIGSSYVEEQQFARFVERLQLHIEDTMDHEFKTFLFSSNINIDPSLYRIKLPSPSNYEKYKQAEMDSTLLNVLSSVDNVQYLAKRFVLSRYLQLSEDEIITNEELLKQERGLDPDADQMIQKLYTAPGGDMGGMGGGVSLGGGMGGMGGMPPDMGGELPPGDEGEDMGGMESGGMTPEAPAGNQPPPAEAPPVKP